MLRSPVPVQLKSLSDGEGSEMRVGRTIKHCHGKDKGKKIRTYKDVATAKRAHRAMMSKKKRKS